eukprot:s1959_g11.t1
MASHCERKKGLCDALRLCGHRKTHVTRKAMLCQSPALSTWRTWHAACQELKVQPRARRSPRRGCAFAVSTLWTVSTISTVSLVSRTVKTCKIRTSCRAHRRTWVQLGMLGAAPLGASAEVKDDSDYAEKARRLLDDPEVRLIRELQQRVQLVDGKGGKGGKGQSLALPQLLRPGSPLYEADLVCVGEIHDSAADHAMQRLLIDALTYQLFLELRQSEGVDASAPRGRTPQNLSAQRVAVGVEYFSRRQQPTLDSLIFDKSKDGLGSSPSKFREA